MRYRNYEFFPPDNMKVQLIREQYALAALKDISALRKVTLWFLMPPTVPENSAP